MDIETYAILSKKIDELEPGGGGGSTYKQFPDFWPTNQTTADLCTYIYGDSTATPGMAYLGEITCSDKPFSGNAEVVVEIQEGPSSGVGKAIHMILSSGTNYPYR